MKVFILHKDKKELLPPPVPPRGDIGPRIGMVARLQKCAFNKAVAEEGLFSGQHRIIMILKRDGYATIGDIAKETGTTASTVSVSIKRMEKAGFVARRCNKEDARISEIYLTKKGEKAPEHIKAKMESEEEMITKGFNEQEKLILSDMIDRIIDNFMKKEDLANAEKTD